MGIDESKLRVELVNGIDGLINSSDLEKGNTTLDLDKISRFSQRNIIVVKYLGASGNANPTAKEFRDMYNKLFDENPLGDDALGMLKEIYSPGEARQLPIFDEDYDTHTFGIPPKQYRRDYGMFSSEPE